MSGDVYEAEYVDTECPKCGHRMVPLSDYGPNGSSVQYKAWVCIECPYQVRIDKGYVSRVMRNPSETAAERKRG